MFVLLFTLLLTSWPVSWPTFWSVAYRLYFKYALRSFLTQAGPTHTKRTCSRLLIIENLLFYFLATISEAWNFLQLFHFKTNFKTVWVQIRCACIHASCSIWQKHRPATPERPHSSKGSSYSPALYSLFWVIGILMYWEGCSTQPLIGWWVWNRVSDWSTE